MILLLLLLLLLVLVLVFILFFLLINLKFRINLSNIYRRIVNKIWRKLKHQRLFLRILSGKSVNNHLLTMFINRKLNNFQTKLSSINLLSEHKSFLIHNFWENWQIFNHLRVFKILFLIFTKSVIIIFIFFLILINQVNIGINFFKIVTKSVTFVLIYEQLNDLFMFLMLNIKI